MSHASAISEQNPWLGLNPFTEALRSYFFGRDPEAGELYRRVKRLRTTVLFGQSGLGKTSLVQAGLFPRLRPEFLPVPLRIDFGGRSSPIAQIKAAVSRAIEAAGLTVESGPTEDETLWEYFHRPETEPRTAEGAPVGIVLALDQFEELFTLGSATPESRKLRDELLRQVGDLVENRVPPEVEKRFEEDETLADRYQFDDQGLRILFSLREDFLPELESLRARMPSLGENRMRLTPMSGRQALEAVLLPGRELVTTEVATEIVRFVAAAETDSGAGEAAADLGRLRVDPALLSLFCRELNEQRLKKGLSRITGDLLAGSRAQILQDFYERCFEGLPASARTLVEDKLLTDAGRRQMVARGEAEKALGREGAAVSAIDELVRRRLLHVEERHGIPYVELTHDRLTDVVERSRKTRRENEAAEVVRLARRKLRNSRRRLALVSVLAGAAVLAAVVALYQQRAAVDQRRIADAALQQALQQRQIADAAQARAEQNEREARIQRDYAFEKQKEADRHRNEALAQKQEADRQRNEALAQKQEAERRRNEAVRQKERVDKLLELQNEMTSQLYQYYKENAEFLEGYAKIVDQQIKGIEGLLADDADNVDVLRSHAFTVATAADLKVKLAKRPGAAAPEAMLSEAREGCRKVRRMAERLAGRSEPAYQRAAILSAGMAAGTLLDTEDLDEATELCRWATGIAEKLQGSERPQGLYWWGLLRQQEAEILLVRAKKSKLANERKEHQSSAVEIYRGAIDLFNQAAEASNQAKYWSQSAAIGRSLGNLLLELNRVEEARDAYVAAKDARQNNLLVDDSAENRQSLATAFSEIGFAEKRLKHYDAARSAYDRCVEIRRAQTRDDAKPLSASLDHDDEEAKYFLAGAIRTRGDLERDLGDKAASRPFYESSLEISEELTAKKPSVAKFQLQRALTLRTLGRVELELNQLPAADAAFLKALEAVESAQKLESDSATVRTDLSTTYVELARLASKEKRYPDARRYLEKKLPLDRRTVELDSSADNRDTLAGTLSELGDACLESGDLEAARAHFAEQLELRRKLVIDVPDNAGYFGGLSFAQLLNGQFADAIQSAERSVQLDPAAVWLGTNLLHGRLLTGDGEKARATYEEYRDKEYGGKPFRELLAGDFAMFRKLKILDERQEQAVKEIEALFDEPK